MLLTLATPAECCQRQQHTFVRFRCTPADADSLAHNYHLH